jgi:hypothetical protein
LKVADPIQAIPPPIASHPQRDGREAEEKGQDRQGAEQLPTKNCERTMSHEMEIVRKRRKQSRAPDESWWAPPTFPRKMVGDAHLTTRSLHSPWQFEKGFASFFFPHTSIHSPSKSLILPRPCVTPLLLSLRLTRNGILRRGRTMGDALAQWVAAWVRVAPARGRFDRLREAFTRGNSGLGGSAARLGVGPRGSIGRVFRGPGKCERERGRVRGRCDRASGWMRSGRGLWRGTWGSLTRFRAAIARRRGSQGVSDADC